MQYLRVGWLNNVAAGRLRRGTSAIAFIAMVMALPHVAAAQPPQSDEIRALRAEIARLSSRLDALERPQGGLPSAPAQPVDTASTPVSAAGPGTSGLIFGRAPDTIFRYPNTFLPPLNPAESSSQEKEEALAIKRSTFSQVASFLLDRPSNRSPGGAQFELGSADSRLTLKATRAYVGKALLYGPNNVITGDQPHLWSWSAGLSAKADEKFANFADGFRAGEVKGTFGLSWVSYRSRTFGGMVDALRGAEKANREACKSEKAAEDPRLVPDALEAACSGPALYQWSLAAKKGAYSHPDAYTTLRSGLWGAAEPIWDVGIEGGIGFNNLKFRDIQSSTPMLDPADRFGVKEETLQPVVWSVDAHLGRFVRAPGKPYKPWFYASLIGEIGREYSFPKKVKDKIVCPPLAPGALNVTCDKMNIGRPTADDFYRVGTEINVKVPGWFLIPDLGLSPQLTIDVADGQLAYELPILFTGDSEGKLNAGIRLKGEAGGTNPDPFSIGLFISTPFKLGN